MVKSGGPSRISYLGFDLTELNSEQIVDAELTLHFVPTGFGLASHVPNATFSVFGLSDNSVAWGKDSLDAENAPANQVGGSGLVETEVRKLGDFVLEQGVQHGQFGIQGGPLTDYLREHAGSEIKVNSHSD